jgi:hypothetical protein
MNFKHKHYPITFILLFLVLISLRSEDSINALIQQLGADSNKERETATSKLWEMQEQSLEALRLAEKSTDPEVKERAKSLIEKIEKGITPKTSKDDLAIIEKFQKVDKQQKARTIVQLSQRDGGWQIIRSLICADLSEELAGLALVKVDTSFVLNIRDKDQEADAGAILELAAVFSKDPTWSYNYLAFVHETKTHNLALAKLQHLISKTPEDNFKMTAMLHFTRAIILRADEQYEKAAVASRKIYKIAFKNNNDELKKICKPLFIDTHLLARKYSYLEKFWEKTSFEVPDKERLWNQLFLQRLQGKEAAFQESMAKLITMMDNKNHFANLVKILLFNGQKEKAQQILVKHQDFETLALLAQVGMDYKSHVKWLQKSDKKESRLELLAFMAENAQKKENKKDLIKLFNESSDLADKVTAAIYLNEARFKSDAARLLKPLLANPELSDNDAFRAAWVLTDSQPLAEVFLALRFKSRTKKPAAALEFVTLLALTDDPDSFTDYLDLLEEKFQGYSRDMPKIIEKLGTYCLEKEWNANAAAIASILPSAQRGIFNSILESEALVRNGQYVKEVHNILGTSGSLKISLPYYIVAQAFKMKKDFEKQKKALAMARYYDMGRENVMGLTSQYLYENAYYEYFLETAAKLTAIGGNLSPARINGFRMLSNSHIHNLKHQQAYKPFMNYYLLSSANISLLSGPSEALRMAYQYNEFKLRDAITNNNSINMDKFANKCQSLLKNNIEVPILLKQSINTHAKAISKKYFDEQWNSMLADIKEYPDHAILLNSAAWLGALCGHELDNCLTMVRKAVKLEPSAANYDTLAEVYYRQKNYKEALKNIEKAAELDKLEPFFKERVKKFTDALNNNR